MNAPRDREPTRRAPVGWQFLDDFVLRRAGFTFDLLSRLRCPATYRLVREASQLDHELTRLEASTREELERRPPATGEAAQRQERERGKQLLRALKARASLPGTLEAAHAAAWNRVLAKWRNTMAAASAGYADESARARQQLVELGSDRKVQEAIYLNSPSFYNHGVLPLVAGSLHGWKRRSAEVALTAYLQRFCAKNDTASYFGPINYGRIRNDASMPALTYRMTVPEAWSRVYASHWFVAELYRMILADEQLQLALPVQRSALVRYSKNQVSAPGLAPMRLDDQSGEVFRESLHGRSGFELAQRLGLEAPRLRAIILELNKVGLLRLSAEPPADRLDVLTAFREMIAAAPRSAARQDWLALVARMTDLLGRFEQADLPARIRLMDELEQLCTDRLQANPRRGAGRLYTDRFVLFDQCVGDIGELTVAGPLAAALAGLATALDLFAWNAREISEAYKRRAWPFIHAANLSGRTVALLELLERVPQPEVLDDRSAWRQFWAATLNGHAPGHVLALSRSHIEASPLVNLSITGLVAAPDIMLAAADADSINRGDFKIVLAEVHPVIVPTQLHFYAYHPQASAVAQIARKALESTFASTEEAILASTRISKITESGLQRVRVHQEWVARSENAEDVPIAELDAELPDQDSCSLRIRGTERHLYLKRPLFVDQPMPAVLGVFERPEVWATEIDVAEHLPRIEVDGIVIQRERWRFGSANIPTSNADRDSFDFYASLVAWQQKHELPEYVFGRALGRGEVKPFLIDFASPLSCIAFVRECHGAAGMVVTEMFPGPDQLWLRGPEGAFTSELRLSAYSPSQEEQAGARHPRPSAPSQPDRTGTPNTDDVTYESSRDEFMNRILELRQTVVSLHVED
jgi:hypothetical protein